MGKKTSKKQQAPKKRASINSEATRKELAELYQNLGIIWSISSHNVADAKKQIENTKYLRKAVKKTIIFKIDNIFNEANGIMDILGKVGKVR